MSISTTMIYMATLAVAVSAGCKRGSPAGESSAVKAEKVAGNTVFLVYHGGYNSCGKQTVPEGENQYELLPFDVKAGASLESVIAAVNSRGCEEKPEDMNRVAQAFSEQDNVNVAQCEGLNLADEKKPRPKERATPLTMDTHTRTLTLAAELERGGSTVQWVTSCYSGDDSDDKAFNLFFVSSDFPDKTYVTSRETMWLYEDIKASRAARSYIMGHSHGGYTAITDILKNPLTKFTGLVTIDPVSIKCGLREMFPVVYGGETVIACRQFPVDFPEADLADVGSRAGFWLNFYQTRGAPHSGTTPLATNTLLDLSHGAIDGAQVTWDAITARIVGAAQTLPPAAEAAPTATPVSAP